MELHYFLKSLMPYTHTTLSACKTNLQLKLYLPLFTMQHLKRGLLYYYVHFIKVFKAKDALLQAVFLASAVAILLFMYIESLQILLYCFLVHGVR
jgi:hypothetical protein